MLKRRGLAVSLPAQELRGINLPGSFFDVKSLQGQVISTTLRGAIHALNEYYNEAGQRLVFIARPEIFTHGSLLAWLREELGLIEDHLSISDGSAIHLVPGLRNHLFFYNSGQYRNNRALKNLVARAPELGPQLDCQINSTLTFRSGAKRHTPQPILLQSKAFSYLGETAIHNFYLNPNSVEDSINRIYASPSLTAMFIDQYKNVTYIPFTDTAAHDIAFCQLVAKLILDILQDPSRVLIIGNPLAQTADDVPARTAAMILRGLAHSGAILPRAVLPNIVLASSLIGNDYFENPGRKSSLILHDSFEFWRCPKAYFSAFSDITIALPLPRRYDERSMLELFAPALGMSPLVVWIGAERRGAIESKMLYE